MMRRIWGLLSILLLTSLILTACNLEEEPTVDIDSTGFDMPDRPKNIFTARVDRVIDGDTLDLDDGTRVRLIGINTPEREQPYYDDALNFLRNRVEDEIVGLEYDVEVTDQFGRTLAYIWLDDNLVNAEILINGYAETYFIPPNTHYESVFNKAKSIAQSNSTGIWKRGAGGIEIRTIFYNAPGRDEDNLNGEWIELENTTNASININNYTLQDSSSNNVYTFSSVVLDGGEIITIYSGCGNDTNTELYWCNDDPIWNNSGDSAMLRDSNGDFVDDYSYSGN